MTRRSKPARNARSSSGSRMPKRKQWPEPSDCLYLRRPRQMPISHRLEEMIREKRTLRLPVARSHRGIHVKDEDINVIALGARAGRGDRRAVMTEAEIENGDIVDTMMIESGIEIFIITAIDTGRGSGTMTGNDPSHVPVAGMVKKTTTTTTDTDGRSAATHQLNVDAIPSAAEIESTTSIDIDLQHCR